jgi:hypothetical protein
MLDGMLDELEKISVAHGRLNQLTKSRSGRRPISARALLDKDKAGKLFKKEADSAGRPESVRGAGADDVGAAKVPRRPDETPSREPNIPHEEKLGDVREAFRRAYDFYYDRAGKVAQVPGETTQTSPLTTGGTPPIEAKRPRKKGEVPTLDDVNVVDRYDGRDFATTVHGPSTTLSGISNGEHA